MNIYTDLWFLWWLATARMPVNLRYGSYC